MKTLDVFDSPCDSAGWELAGEALVPGAGGGALQQDWAYGVIAAGAGRRVRRLEIRQGTERIGLAQAIGRRGLWLISRGPVFAPGLAPDLRRAALRAVARALLGVTLVTPEEPVAGFGLIPLVTARHQAIWSLGPEEAHLRAGLEAKWRNRLAAAERAGLRLVPEPEPGWLIRAEADQRAARGYKALPGEFIRAWEIARPGGVLALAVLSEAGEKIAGGVFLRHGRGASYQIGWSGEEGRARGAHNLLLWQAGLRLRRAGVRRLDLGDINSEAGAGLMRFKLGTGAVAQSLGASALVLP